MPPIALDSADEAVKRFFLSLPDDPQGTILEVNGRTFRVQALANGSEAPPGDWTEEKNHHRCLLIEKEVDGVISPEEALELEDLQAQLRRHRRQVAPFPWPRRDRRLRNWNARRHRRTHDPFHLSRRPADTAARAVRLYRL